MRIFLLGLLMACNDESDKQKKAKKPKIWSRKFRFGWRWCRDAEDAFQMIERTG